METSAAGAEDSESRMLVQHPGARRLLFRFARIPTMADALPSIVQIVTTSGKLSALAFFAIYFALILLWLPFWLLAFLVTEIGVYVLSVATVFYLGRAVIRMIAFPGASSKVVSEIESEFAKYSVRMLVSAANCLRELATAVVSTDEASNRSNSELQILWKRSKSYRDRALGVYLDVLENVYGEEQQIPSQPDHQRTRFGTNRIRGDIGHLKGLTPQAREDGKELVKSLQIVLGHLDKLEAQASDVLHGSSGSNATMISDEARVTAALLLSSSNELRDFVTSLKPPSADGGDDEDVTVDAMRRRVEEQSGTPMGAIKSGLASVLPMLDPPPHTSIFGFDVLRGTVLSRYLGARQFWVPRPSGGMLDVIHIPTKKRDPNLPRNPKAVMYCNPNAGLCEVATGMSLAGGNIGEDEATAQDSCWSDFYTDQGLDMYLYNYAGFGRSFGTSMFVKVNVLDEDFIPGIFGRLRRIFRAAFFTFKPTPDTLREDGLALANHLVREMGIESLVIHGESIGGVAASRTAQRLSLSNDTRDKVALLICDRTFCNLEAVAQRLVGNWSGYAIRGLAPFWDTDVAGDFLTALCPKVVANDCADQIIADSSSLKAGIAQWRELQRGLSSTKGIGWAMEIPVEYRMADWENVSVLKSQYVTGSGQGARAPVWPQDKHVTPAEAFHFAACVRRIGRKSKEDSGRVSEPDDDDGGVELGRVLGGSSTPVRRFWEILACCDGMCGAPLGMSVKFGIESTVVWLCCCLTFGCQLVVEKAEQRQSKPVTDGVIEVILADFDLRPEGYEQQESAKMVHPKPLSEVLQSLKSLLSDEGEAFTPVKHEVNFVIGMLDYTTNRLSSPTVTQAAWKCKHGKPEETMVGNFLNLHCGHNNAFSAAERQQLRIILEEMVGI